MLGIGKHRNLALCRSAPQQIDDGPILLIDRPDHCVRKLLPASALMGICLMGTYREHSVEKEHALVCPLFQLSLIRYVAAEIILQLFVNIHERRRDLLGRFHGKTHALCLMLLMIGILS